VAASASPLRTLLRDPLLRQAGGALALYRLAEFGPWVAMLVFAYSHGGATATGLVSLALLVPTALCAPFAGPAIDRFGASRMLVSGYAAQALALGATAASLLAGAPPLVSYVCGAVAAIVLTVTHPAHAVVSPGIARTAEQLVALNAITGWILSVGLVAAPAAAGVILGLSGPGTVYLAGAICVAASTALVFPLRRLVPPLARPEARVPAIRELAEGARSLRAGGPTSEVMLVVVATFVMVGAFDVLAVVLAVGVLDIGGSGAGYLTAVHGGGAVIGAGLSFALVGRARLVPVLLGAALVGSVAFIVLGLAVSLVAALIVAAVAGVSRSLLEVSAATLLQRVTPTSLLARVFAFKEGLAMGAWALGSVLVPGFIALGGTRLALIGTGSIVPVVVLARLRRLLLVDAAATVPVVAIALLRSMRIFRVLPVPALEGVAHGARNVSYPAGSRIIAQGERGDRYYAVADGSVEVTRDGGRSRCSAAVKGSARSRCCATLRATRP
jgi:MFS family permease